jgi:hypothetical protein
MSTLKITKVGKDEPSPTLRKKTMKTFPRGVLKKTMKAKIEPVRDPAKPPPLKEGTLRILTPSGENNRRKTIKNRVKGMKRAEVRQILSENRINLNPKTPDNLAKEILEGGLEAGLIVAPSN